MDYLRKFPLGRIAAAIVVGLVLIAVFLFFFGRTKIDPTLEPIPFKLGIVTGTVENAPEENRALAALANKLSEESSIVSLEIKRVPGLKAHGGKNSERTAGDLKEAALTLAEDPRVKVILIMPGVLGTRDAFFEVKKKRPDLTLLSGNALEDPGPLAMVADLVASYDFNAQGYLVVQGAGFMGAGTVVSVDYKSNAKLVPNARRDAAMESACYEMGLNYAVVEIDDLGTERAPGAFAAPAAREGRGAAGPPGPEILTEAAEAEETAELSSNKSPGASPSESPSDSLSASLPARALYGRKISIPLGERGVSELIKESFPGWLGAFGEDALFFGGAEDISEALLEEASDSGGYFRQGVYPSPFIGYPKVLKARIPEGESGEELLRLYDAAAEDLGLRGKIASARVSSAYDIFLALAETGMDSVKWKRKPVLSIFSGFLKALSSEEPRVVSYKDFVTGREIPDYLMVAYGDRVLGEFLGAGPGPAPALPEVPMSYETLRPPLFYDATNFRMGIVTGPAFQSSDDYYGAEELLKVYGDAEKGGRIRHLTYEAEFSENPDKVTDLIVSLAEDPFIKLITINQGVPGTIAGFSKVRELRPDVLLMSSESHEEFYEIIKVADLTTGSSSVLRGYLIPHTAKRMGAKTFVHMSFPRHMAYRNFQRRRDIMKAASKDLGMEFVEITTPDPQDVNYGVKGAQRVITESFPAWIEEYGKDAAFFTTNDAQNAGIIQGIVDTKAGYFVEGDIPSPLVGYPEVFGLEVQGVTDWFEFVKELEKRAEEKGVSGRLGLWVYPLGFCESAGTLEFGRLLVQGETSLEDMAPAFLSSYGKFSPGAVWNGSYHSDELTGRPVRNLFLMYQDTYVLGRGYMLVHETDIPEKYLVIGTAREEKEAGD
jgi:hypothetical protein